MRRAFSLMITLSVLAVVIALASILLGYFSETKKEADLTKARIQANLFYSDIQNEFKKFKGKRFKQIYRYPLSLHSDDMRFVLRLHCLPLNSGININWLAYENEKDEKNQARYQEAQKLFDFLTLNYGVEDAQRLLEMIRSQVKSGTPFLKKPQSRLRQKNGIISYRQFADIITQYENETDDRKVAHIPWSRYFVFSPTVRRIELEYATPELIAYLFDIDLSTVKEWFALPLEEKGSLRNFIENNGGDLTQYAFMLSDAKTAVQARCDVSFKGDGGTYRFAFDYIDGKAKYFEFYGK